MPPHLPRCQGIAVGLYSFTLGRLESGAPSTFAFRVSIMKNGWNYLRIVSKPSLENNITMIMRVVD